MIKIIIKQCIAAKGLPQNIIEDVQADLTFDNPAYLSAKREGRWIPQGVVPYIYLYQMTGDIIYFPKGYMNNLLHKIGKKEHTVIDHSISPELTTPITFTSTLRDYQEAATKDILPKRYGVLEAATGAGKTAIGINIIAVRNVRTLVLVHSKELLNQWQSALKKHTNIEKIGAIGDSKFDIQDVTIGIIKSVKNNIDKLQGQFGQVIADECHRVFASSWISVLNSLNAKYVLGLSATPYRREKFTTKGIYFSIGPKVHVVDKKYLTDIGAVLIPRVIRHPTGFRTDRDTTTAGYSELISMISTDESRNRVIVNAIIKDITTYKEPVMIVSDRVAHCEALLDMLRQYRIVTPILLTGGKPAAYRKWAVEQLTRGESNALISTTSLLGEGFDSPILNALFLCTPVKFEGRLIQVVGRILRPSACQELPRLVDFRDNNVEMLLRSGWARDSVYKRAGWK